MSGYYQLLSDQNDNKLDLSSSDIKNSNKLYEQLKISKSLGLNCENMSVIPLLKYSLIYLLFISSVIFYLTSLIGCKASFKECQNNSYMRFYIKLGLILVFSCLIFSLSLTIHIIMQLNRINYLIFFGTYFIIFFRSQGTDFTNHGTYNFIVFMVLFPLSMIIYFIIYKIGYCCYNSKRKNLSFIIVAAIIIFIIIMKYKTGCYNFYDGLGNEKIKNDPLTDSCEFIYPNICGLDLFSGLFDVNYFRWKCDGINDKKEIFFKYLDKSKMKYDKFSLPRTEHWAPKKSYKNLANMVEKNIKEIEEGKNIINEREITISFNKEGTGTVDINLKKNYTLIKERRKIADENPVKYNNIYILYLDAISRNHFRRKMKKTIKIIEKMLYANKNKEDSEYKNYNSFQFFKYHNLEGHTQGNNMPFIYGNSQFSDTGISMTKFFKEKGFITCATQNSCNKELFDWSSSSFKSFEFSDWDHENFALFCDPNFEDKKNKWSIINGKCSVLRRCFYGRDSFDYSFDYVSQFLEAYKNERKFFKLMASDGHEITLEVVKYIDNSLSKFLEKLLYNYTDDKTAIIIMSDHGAQMPGPYDALFFKERWMEKYLGVFFLILPKNIDNNTNINYENIFYNQQKFITTYDIHDTLLDILNVDKMKYSQMNHNKGQSLFQKINGKKRNCTIYKKEIKNCYCKEYNIKK